jgi:hypothetical protein
MESPAKGRKGAANANRRSPLRSPAAEEAPPNEAVHHPRFDGAAEAARSPTGNSRGRRRDSEAAKQSGTNVDDDQTELTGAVRLRASTSVPCLIDRTGPPPVIPSLDEQIELVDQNTIVKKWLASPVMMPSDDTGIVQQPEQILGATLPRGRGNMFLPIVPDDG